MAAPVLSLEFNELCPPLLDRWMADGTLPHFKRLHDEADVFTTEPDVTTPDRLEPWIQWYSIHTGLAYDQHGVFHLTDGLRAEHQDIWRALIGAGRAVFSFASMNVRPFAAPGSLFVGDPWVENGDAFPPELNAYNRFIGHNVREYSNADRGLRPADHAAFLRFLVTHGLTPRTAWQVARQLGGERRQPHLSYRRVAILDALQYDVFAHYYRTMQPDFASFFVNSVAHLQHSYWRHMEPDAFAARPGDDDLARYGDAIRFGYRALDTLVGRFLKLADRRGATILFQTALSQQPFTRHEGSGGQHFHRLRDAPAFIGECGIQPVDLNPTMTHQYMLTFTSEPDRSRARERLEAFVLDDGRAVFDFPAHETPLALYFGAQISWAADPETPVIDRATGRHHRLGDLFYAMDGTKSGCHHPEGALWIRRGRHRRHEAPVSILDIFPTILEMMDVRSDPGARRGHSLVGRLSAETLAA